MNANLVLGIMIILAVVAYVWREARRDPSIMEVLKAYGTVLGILGGVSVGIFLILGAFV